MEETLPSTCLCETFRHSLIHASLSPVSLPGPRFSLILTGPPRSLSTCITWFPSTPLPGPASSYKALPSCFHFASSYAETQPTTDADIFNV